MRTMKISILTLLQCTFAIVCAQSGSAYAPLGTATRYTNVNGSVLLADGNNGLEITNNLDGLSANKKYDLYLLPASCPAKAPLDNGGTAKLRSAAKAAKKLGSIGGNAKSIAPVKALTLSSVMSKGILLIQGGRPIECADITPSNFGPPPAPPSSRN